MDKIKNIDLVLKCLNCGREEKSLLTVVKEKDKKYYLDETEKIYPQALPKLWHLCALCQKDLKVRFKV